MAITAADFELPGGIESYEQFKKAQKAPKFIEERDVNDEMGRKSFSFCSQPSCKIKTL